MVVVAEVVVVAKVVEESVIKVVIECMAALLRLIFCFHQTSDPTFPCKLPLLLFQHREDQCMTMN